MQMGVKRVISIHALREEGDHLPDDEVSHALDFYPRPPRGGRHLDLSSFSTISIISIHALREEGDNIGSGKPSGRTYFYPRPPRGGRLFPSLEMWATILFLSTPSARRATQDFTEAPQTLAISIHALREEGDYHNRADDCRAGQFLSTPSARRATPCPCTPLCSQNKFLSTPSARRATSSALHFAGRRAISIHALREEGDGTHSVNDSKSADFYPRPPRGGRHERNGNFEEAKEFLSTPSARRATGGAVRLCMRSGISIHALREEGDMGLIPPFCTMSHFYPRPPRGGRQQPYQNTIGES